MDKRFTNRLLALLLAWWLAASFVLPVARAAEGEQVTISTVEDFQKFAQSCSLDTWSQGKTFVLTADLELEGQDFAPIPTFGGTFLGQGHTISGLRLTSAGSTQGLFRYVQPAGVVRDLTVTGLVAPEGTRSTVGGIVGDNAGILENCAFQGVVQGESMVGGVAGRNAESGQLIGCSASGSVSGENATGGIAGRSLGLLLKCVNSAGVNLTQTEGSVDLLGADAGTALEERVTADDETYYLLGSCFDTGGIVGDSSGVVQGCTNNGAVGYPHVGYNTGGIAGRQSGYLTGCVNNGTIHGRKDVGGIVGQAEPYVVMDPGRDVIEELRQELGTLESLINRALDNAQHTGDDVSARLSVMGDYTSSAGDSAKEMLDHVSDFTDENINTVNILSADITNALDQISPALDDLSDAGQKLERMSRKLEKAMDSLGDAVDTSDRALREVRSALSVLRQFNGELGTAINRFQQALDAFDRFLPSGIGLPSLSELGEARRNLRSAFSAMQSAGDQLDSAILRLERALEAARPLSGELEDALEDLQGAANSSAAIGRLLDRAFDTIGDAVDDLTADGPVEFTPLGEEFRQASDSLYSSMSSLFDEMEGLNGVLQSANSTLTSDLRAINRQCNVVFALLLDSMDEFLDDVEEGPSRWVEDTSEEDIAATREGKVADCRSTGAVEGDRNVGGIVGAMAIEFELDPEDDTAGRFSFGATYETKAVLQSCLNYGSVTAKKDCVGGMVGRMDLGTALDCQNYGPVASTSGDYVGGVAGFADASVRSCYAKNTLSGGNYVGGIAGWASRLQGSYAIATIIEGTEYLGAVAGSVETDGVLRDNHFVDTGVAGVDGVSYAGRADPIPFDELSQIPGVPLEFTAFTLTLTAEGETVAQIPFLYGEDLSRIQLPPVPEQEGCYGMWPEFDRSGLSSDLTVEAVYAPWITVTASQELSGKLSLALAEGQFTEEAVLHVSESTQLPPQNSRDGTVVWDISLTGSGLDNGDTVPLRLLNPNGGKAAVWQYRDGQWQQVETVENGQYLLLAMEGTQATFCIQPQPGGNWMILAAAVGAAVLAALLVIVGKKKKKPAKSQKEKEPAAKG